MRALPRLLTKSGSEQAKQPSSLCGRHYSTTHHSHAGLDSTGYVHPALPPAAHFHHGRHQLDDSHGLAISLVWFEAAGPASLPLCNTYKHSLYNVIVMILQSHSRDPTVLIEGTICLYDNYHSCSPHYITPYTIMESLTSHHSGIARSIQPLGSNIQSTFCRCHR
jgi:hypothetical protein